MVGWHHQLNGQELEQALGYGEGQGSLVCSSLDHKESDMTEQLSNNNGTLTHSEAKRQTLCVYSTAQSCPILCGPMDCRPPGSSVPGIL